MTFAVIFLGFAITGVQANQVKKSKSNVSNNKTNPAKSEVCDDGNTNDADCVKAGKDFNADPYVETTQRDRASGQATGKRMHKPVTVTTEAATSAPSSNDGAAQTSSSSAPAGTASEGCCPGRCCPPEQTGTDAATTSSVTSASPGTGDGSSGGDPAPQLKPGSDPFKGTNIARLKQQKAAAAARNSGSSEGCCPGRCCPPEAQDHAINTKGTGTGGITEEQTGSADHAINTKGTGTAGRSKQSEVKANAKSAYTADAAAPAEGCCPGRCCPPDAQDHAINTKGTGTAGIAEEQSAAKPTYDLKAAKK